MLRVGVAVLILGVIWDIVFHATEILGLVVASGLYDLIGNLGHLVTLLGLVLVVIPFLRKK
jgi:hypothetical protein